jgi:hypothetical protein
MDEPQIPPRDVSFQRNTEGKTMNTLVLEKIHPFPTSHTNDGEPFELEEGDVKMYLDDQDLAGITNNIDLRSSTYQTILSPTTTIQHPSRSATQIS